MIEFRELLYGLNKDGSFKVWEVTVESFGTPQHGLSHAELTLIHGKEGGKMQVKPETFYTGHQGRDAVEQAVLEAKARVKKMLDKNMRRTKLELTDLPVLAMLAHPYEDYAHKVDWSKPVYGSDKLDGLRCLAKRTEEGVTLESRTGQPYDVPHIKAQLEQVMRVGDIYDGELYAHGPVLQDIKSAVDRTDAYEKWLKLDEKWKKLKEKDPDGKKTAEARQKAMDACEIHLLRGQLQFIVFDALLQGNDKQMVFGQRLEALYHHEYTIWPESGLTHVKVLGYITLTGEDDLKRFHKDAVSRGFEGVMVRNYDGIYLSGKRSSDLLKYKEFFDKEFKILDVKEDKFGGAIFVLENDLPSDDGFLEEFDCVLGTMEWRQAAAEQKELYIAQYMTVQFQSRYKRTLLPQFPTGKLIRPGYVNQDGEFIPTV